MISPVWTVPGAPGGPTEPASLITVSKARLSPWSETPTGVGRRCRSTGAVYDSAGELVPQSLRAGGFDGDHVTPADPTRYAETPATRIAGRWLYGGHWMLAYGHFLTETLTTLWPDCADIAGIIFHRFLHTPLIAPWQLQLLHRSGWDLPLYVAEHPVVVDELLVPSRPFYPGRSTTPESVTAWLRAVRPAPPQPPLFMSRSRLPKAKQRTDGDERLDQAFGQLGFRVMYPETVSLSEQLAAAGGAPIVAGLAGSALHVSAILPDGPKVLELGDSRTPDSPVRAQLVIDAARGREHAFIPYFAAPDQTRDLDQTVAAVRALL